MDAPAIESVPGGEPPAGETVSPLLSLLPYVRRLLHREPALVITLGYLLLAVAGLAYSYGFYRRFDVPILSLLQIGDFLVAGIVEPAAILLMLSTLPLCWLMDRWNMQVFRRQVVTVRRLRAQGELSWFQRKRLAYLESHVAQVRHGGQLRMAYLLVVTMYGWLFVSIYGGYRAAAIKRGEVQFVVVWLNGEASRLAPPKAENWTYLGATGSYLFVYDRQAAQAEVLPVNAVARMEPLPLPVKAAKMPLIVPIP